MSDVLVITLQLDARSQAHFQHLRDRYFPKNRNLVPAHITLFHAIPSSMLEIIQADLERATEATAFELEVLKLSFMGFGVMYELSSKELVNIHSALQKNWWDELTNQDRQRFKAHVVVQNKVPPDVAKQTFATLSADFKTFKVTAESILLWSYLNGPWRLERRFPFATSE